MPYKNDSLRAVTHVPIQDPGAIGAAWQSLACREFAGVGLESNASGVPNFACFSPECSKLVQRA
jgi:hypothetical protein